MARGRYDVLRGNELIDELVSFCSAGLTAGAEDKGGRPESDNE